MTNIKVTELDFFEIKENLKNFLKQQNEFKDYDFEGSGLQVLLDLLASNTYYNSIYQNIGCQHAQRSTWFHSKNECI